VELKTTTRIMTGRKNCGNLRHAQIIQITKQKGKSPQWLARDPKDPG